MGMKSKRIRDALPFQPTNGEATSSQVQTVVLNLHLVSQDQVKGINLTPKIWPQRHCPVPDRSGDKQSWNLTSSDAHSPFSYPCHDFGSKELSTQNRAEVGL